MLPRRCLRPAEQEGQALVRKHKKTKVAVRLTPKTGTPVTSAFTLTR